MKITIQYKLSKLHWHGWSFAKFIQTEALDLYVCMLYCFLFAHDWHSLFDFLSCKTIFKHLASIQQVPFFLYCMLPVFSCNNFNNGLLKIFIYYKIDHCLKDPSNRFFSPLCVSILTKKLLNQAEVWLQSLFSNIVEIGKHMIKKEY